MLASTIGRHVGEFDHKHEITFLGKPEQRGNRGQYNSCRFASELEARALRWYFDCYFWIDALADIL